MKEKITWGKMMRISKNTFIKLITIREHEYKALEKYLEEKALEGWMIQDIICGFLIFKKKEPQKCKFAVDIFTENEKDEYIEYCEAAGWKHLFRHNKYFIFYTKDQGITPIQTDEEIVLKKVRKSILRNLIYNIFLIGSIIFNLSISAKNGYGFVSDISDNSALLLMASLIVIITSVLIMIIRDTLWYFKSNRAFKLNESINYPTLKSFKVKNVFLQLYMCILALMFISFIGDLGSNKGYIYLSVFVLLITISISRFIIILLKKYRKTSRILGVLICITGVIISTHIVLSGKEMINYVRDESKTPIMTINDFIDMKTNKEYLYFASSQSFLASSYTYSYDEMNYDMEYDDAEVVDEQYNDEDSGGYFEYEICKSKYDWVIDKTFESYLKRYKYYEYDEVKDNNWDALVVYKDNQYNSGYLLKYKDRVISVSGSIDFSKENIEFIKNKLLNW